MNWSHAEIGIILSLMAVILAFISAFPFMCSFRNRSFKVRKNNLGAQKKKRFLQESYQRYVSRTIRTGLVPYRFHARSERAHLAASLLSLPQKTVLLGAARKTCEIFRSKSEAETRVPSFFLQIWDIKVKNVNTYARTHISKYVRVIP